MNQYPAFANEIGVEIFNLEVVDMDRRFKKFMLNPFDYNMAAVAEDKYVACTKVARKCPAEAVNIEWVGRAML